MSVYSQDILKLKATVEQANAVVNPRAANDLDGKDSCRTGL